MPSSDLLEVAVNEGPERLAQNQHLAETAARFARTVGGHIVPESIHTTSRVEGGGTMNRSMLTVAAMVPGNSGTDG